jgi:hypothetical protein
MLGSLFATAPNEPKEAAASATLLLVVFEERICRESLRAQECASSPAETRVSGFVIVELQVISSTAKEKCAAAK